MTKISFQLKFDKKVDSKGAYNNISKFWNKFFIKNLSDSLVHSVEFSENYAMNFVEEGTMSKKKFNSYAYRDFKETAKNTSQEIKDSIVYEVVSTNDSIQDINVSFSINYNVPES